MVSIYFPIKDISPLNSSSRVELGSVIGKKHELLEHYTIA